MVKEVGGTCGSPSVEGSMKLREGTGLHQRAQHLRDIQIGLGLLGLLRGIADAGVLRASGQKSAGTGADGLPLHLAIGTSQQRRFALPAQC